MHDRLVSRRTNALHQCFLVVFDCDSFRRTPKSVSLYYVELSFVFKIVAYLFVTEAKINKEMKIK